METTTESVNEVALAASRAAEPVVRTSEPPGSDVRITVSLIPKVAGGLTWLQQRTNMSKTDIANRAISSYKFLAGQLDDGRELIIRDKKTGESMLVQFL